MSKLTIVRGLPGSGKSTYARQFHCAHFENDMFFMVGGCYQYNKKLMPKAISWCNEMVFRCIAEGFDVVVSNTFVKVEHIKPLVDFAKRYGCIVQVHRMTGNYGNKHNVPQDVLDRMSRDFEDYEGEKKIFF